MAKIICENARVATATEDNPWVDIECRKDCPICQGAGYTEADVVEVEKARNKLIEHSTLDGLMAYTTPLSIWLDSLKDAK